MRGILHPKSNVLILSGCLSILIFSAFTFLIFSGNTAKAQKKQENSNDIFSKKVFTGERVTPTIRATTTYEEILEFEEGYQTPPLKYILQSKGGRPKNPPAEEMPAPSNSIFKDNPEMFFDYDRLNRQNESLSPAVVSPTPNDDFQGLDDANTLIPPDTHGAAGPNHLMTALNTQVRIQNKTGTTISTVSLNSFFSSVGGGGGTFDPRVLYDQMDDRWIVVAVDDAVAATSKVLIAVSQTNDPTGMWSMYGYEHDATNAEWADYPMVGYNKDWIAIGINDFTVPANGFGGAQMYVFDKSTLYAGVMSPTLTRFDLGMSDGNVHQPAETFDSNESTLYVLQRWNSNFGGNGFLRIYTITGTPASPVFTNTSLFPSTSAWSGSAVPAPQNGSAVTLTTNDTRMQSVIMRDGSLWATHTIFLPSSSPNRASVQWWQIVPTTGTVTQVGRIDDATGTNFYAFPSIAVNAANQALIAYSTFSSTTFASAAYSYRGVTEVMTTTQDSLTYKSGVGCYNKTFSGSTNRWGDYSHISVDPNDDTTFWALQEYAETPVGTPCNANTGRWGTWWAKLIPPCAPAGSGNWNTSGTWACGSVPTASDDAVIIDGQTVILDVNPTAASIIVNSGGTLALNGNQTVSTDIELNGTLDLTNGILDMGANTLKIGCGGSTFGASATGYVVGKVEKEFCTTSDFSFPVGENGYSPVGLSDISLSTNPTTLTVDVIDSTLGGLDTFNSASRTWDLTGSGLTADLAFTYLDADVNGSESNYKVFRKIGASNPTDQCGAPCTNTGTNTATAMNQSSFSQWGVGALAPTAAAANVSGRVLTEKGRGIPRAFVRVTDQNGQIRNVVTNIFGYFHFAELPVGNTYTFSVAHKQFNFTSRIVNLEGNLSNFDFIASP